MRDNAAQRSQTMTCAQKWFVSCAALLVVIAVCHDASAQYRGSRQIRRPKRSSVSDQPALSPYINLTNPTVDPGLSYVGLTAPMLQQQENIERNARSLRRLQGRVEQDESSAYGANTGIAATGHHSHFRNLSHFFGGQSTSGSRPTSPFKRRSGAAGAGTGGMGMTGMGGMGGMGMGY
jgi:hypothetical protein